MKNKGVFSICPTPFKPGGELDLQSLVSLVNFQLEAGIHGLAILGVMGELHKLSTFERRRVIETVVAGVRGAVPVWVGVRARGTAAAVEQARSAEADDEMQVSFYRQTVQAIPIPVVIHDFPELFAARISPALAVRLKEEAGVSILNSEDPPVGQKITAVRGLSGDALPILSGLGGMHFLEELQRGADGVVTGFSFPEILLKVYALYRQGEQQEAARVFDRYCSLIRYEFQPLVALALRKYSYMRRGIIACDATRDPATALDHLSRDEFEAVVRRVGLDLSVMGVQTV